MASGPGDFGITQLFCYMYTESHDRAWHVLSRSYRKQKGQTVISHDLKMIFIHIPKCAGTSVETAFGHYTGRGGQDHRTIRRIEKPLISLNVFRSRENVAEFLGRGRKSLIWRARNLGLLPAEMNIKNQHVVTRHQYAEYKKFALVRNPWARAFSWYQNVMRDRMHQAALRVSGDLTFPEFVSRFNGSGFLRPQMYWLKDASGALPFDFIGKMENLEADFATMCDMLGQKDMTLPHKIAGGSRPYADAYDTASKHAIETVCAEEIEQFEYRFGQD